jgi:hypothetical protein
MFQSQGVAHLELTALSVIGIQGAAECVSAFPHGSVHLPERYEQRSELGINFLCQFLFASLQSEIPPMRFMLPAV